MELFERIKKIGKVVATSDSAIAAAIGMKQSTFSGYLNEQRQHNLWPLLPLILEAFPHLSRQWLYFGEGPMLKDAQQETAERTVYPDDPLGRIAALTGLNTHDALQLQLAFGVDYSEIRPWLGAYLLAREAMQKWRAEGGTEETMPEPPARIPDAWLNYFWGHYGPNPGWVQYGDHPHGSAPKLMPNPLSKELDKLHAQLDAAERNLHALHQQKRMTEDGAEQGDEGLARMPHTAPGNR
ncbi:hypothetical protein IG626_01980 [Desulfovibrio desulfuricans]|uniref:hypothetical protein n=1 Tax=Desulfovibrio desulfuricans TaxID=876 RepID=UPI0017874B5A|nr:hypothetical protein [Desulfovibrio desulfuricans]MBD8894758.1 hypothetical protein [Desulfovibrio desulfuricans]